MKKLLVVTLCLIMILSMGCGADKKTGINDSPEIVFPEKDLKIIVPFSPGGAVDTTCRIIAEKAPQYLDGKKIIIENMPGGGAVIGQTFVAKADPDGYTILGFTSSVVSNPLTKETTYTHKDFQPVVMYCFDPEVLVVPSDSKFKKLEDFMEYAKENEVKMNTPGHSTSHHIANLMLQNELDLKFGFLHNEGAPQQIQQLLGGHCDAGLMAFGEAQGQIKDGQLKALGTMAYERRKDFPDIPTFKETGIDMVYGAWRGLAVPQDTPEEAVNILAEAFKKVIESQEFIDQMTKAGYPIIYRGPQDFAEYVDKSAETLKVLLPQLKQED